MGDSLERFVIKHREDFDSEEPSPEVWERIQKSKPRKTGNSSYSNLWKVASMILLVTTVALLIERSGMVNSDQDENDLAISDFEQVENYYVELIAIKRKELISYSDTEIKSVFLREVARLDQVYVDLKAMTDQQMAGKTLTNAMITNLQLRIEILNKQLEILKSLNTRKDDKTANVEA